MSNIIPTILHLLGELSLTIKLWKTTTIIPNLHMRKQHGTIEGLSNLPSKIQLVSLKSGYKLRQ